MGSWVRKAKGLVCCKPQCEVQIGANEVAELATRGINAALVAWIKRAWKKVGVPTVMDASFSGVAG